MQKPLASAIQKKSTEGFFLATYAGLEGPPQAVALAMEREGTRGTPESP